MSEPTASPPPYWKTLKPVIWCFVLAFFLAAIALQLPFLIGQPNLGDSFTRFRKEGTAVELYAEDIWRNGRRTLTTAFDPTSCTIAYRRQWVVRWSEVSCIAEDYAGRRWQYTTRYNDNFTSLFFLPFFVDAGPVRELHVTEPAFIAKENAK